MLGLVVAPSGCLLPFLSGVASSWSIGSNMFSDFDRWQVAHLVLGQVEPDAIRHILYGIYRDGNPFLAPKMAFVQEHMGNVMVAWVDDQPLDPSDTAIGGGHWVPAAHLHLPQGYPVTMDKDRGFGAATPVPRP